MTEVKLHGKINKRRMDMKRKEYQKSIFLEMNSNQSEIRDRIFNSKFIMGWNWNHQTIKRFGANYSSRINESCLRNDKYSNS